MLLSPGIFGGGKLASRYNPFCRCLFINDNDTLVFYMKIREFSDDRRINELRSKELLELLCQPTDKEKRPCISCHKICNCDKHSNRCTCDCSVDCSDAPRYLSSDPDRYPIESNVVPLVYVMSALRVVPPCWSCEGHFTSKGGLQRLPQLWFYSASTIYPELISEYLKELDFHHQVNYSWMVTVCPHTESNVTTFTIMPERPDDVKMSEIILQKMQSDFQTISVTLREGLFQLAKYKLSKMNV